ncbi:CPBP family intramembrane metalloprotease [Candidatus Thorarchaeota archaeon]|nr:MAG: CPBP family intramembrane metalloprotease [Candidatus Thorarchaeota archaeon]
MTITQILESVEKEQTPSSTWASTGLLQIAGIMLTISVIWRIVDQFVLGFGSTWMNIFPSKLFPFLIILGFFWKYRQQEVSSVLGLSREKIRVHLLIGLLIGIIIAIGIDIGGTIIYNLLIDSTYPLQLHVLNEGLLGYMFIFFLTNAFLEETLFRGLLINALKMRQSVNISIILSAIIFGLWHTGWPIVNGAMGGEVIIQVVSMVFFTTVLGLFFGIYYQRFNSSKSLVGPIIVHTIINFVSECFKVGPEPIIQGPDLVFSNSGLMAITFLIFFLIFIPLGVFLWKYTFEHVTSLWQQFIGRINYEEQEDLANGIDYRKNDKEV